MLILIDNDVVGAVRAFRRILESPGWVDMTVTLELQFIELKDVALPIDAPDGAGWQRSQDLGALLMTGNRSSGAGSLDQTIAEQAGPESLLVLTIGDPRRGMRFMRESVRSACWTSSSASRRCAEPDGFSSHKSGRRNHASRWAFLTSHDCPLHQTSIRIAAPRETGLDKNGAFCHLHAAISIEA